MNALTGRQMKVTGAFDVPYYFRYAYSRYGLAIAFRWVADALIRDWRTGELFAGFIAYDECKNEVGRGWTPTRACRKAGWPTCSSSGVDTS